ncbi:unnamed protein product [Rotaria sp. Silwood1]|nr:unnamed protein product [Rotaria sp. Silwood1]
MTTNICTVPVRVSKNNREIDPTEDERQGITLNNVDLLYSLMGINVKLTQFIRDPIFTNRLTLFRYSSNDLIYPLDNTILDRFCLQILPEIHHKIKWLNVEPLSMERILLITNYSNLHGLGLYNIEDETFRRLFAGKKYDDSSIHQNLEVFEKSESENLDRPGPDPGPKELNSPGPGPEILGLDSLY